jgi:hypothetical protein
MSERKRPNAIPPGKTDNHEREPWKAPLPIFMESGSTLHQAGRWAETERHGRIGDAGGVDRTTLW